MAVAQEMTTQVGTWKLSPPEMLPLAISADEAAEDDGRDDDVGVDDAPATVAATDSEMEAPTS